MLDEGKETRETEERGGGVEEYEIRGKRWLGV